MQFSWAAACKRVSRKCGLHYELSPARCNNNNYVANLRRRISPDILSLKRLSCLFIVRREINDLLESDIIETKRSKLYSSYFALPRFKSLFSSAPSFPPSLSLFLLQCRLIYRANPVNSTYKIILISSHFLASSFSSFLFFSLFRLSRIRLSDGMVLV